MSDLYLNPIKEIWKPIINYENLYEISNCGRIKSLPKFYGEGYHKEKILKQYKDKNGYMHITLYNNKIKKCYQIHRLVLEAFFGPCHPGMEGCHNNGKRDNNFIENLRYDTKKNNQADRLFHGTNYYNLTTENTSGSKNHKAKLNEKQVRIIKWLLKDGYLTQIEIAKIFGVNSRTISAINRNIIWKFVNV